MVSCVNGYLDIATLLCERGAALNLEITDGDTAIYLASRHNHLECVRLLCDRGADTLLPGLRGNPYALACTKFGIESPMAVLLQLFLH